MKNMSFYCGLKRKTICNCFSLLQMKEQNHSLLQSLLHPPKKITMKQTGSNIHFRKRKKNILMGVTKV